MVYSWLMFDGRELRILGGVMRRGVCTIWTADGLNLKVVICRKAWVVICLVTVIMPIL